MLRELLTDGISAYRHTRRKPSLGLALVANEHPARVRPANNNGALDTLDKLQQDYVTPLLDRVCEAAELHLAGTQLDTTSRAVVGALDAFQHDYVDPLIDHACDASVALLRDHLMPRLPSHLRPVYMNHIPLIGGVRQHHARLLIGADDPADEPTAEEQALQRRLVVTVATFGLVSGAIFFPALTLLSLPGFLYVTTWQIAAAYRQIAYERRIGIDVINGATTFILLVTGQFWMAALTELLFTPAEIMTLKTRRRARHCLVTLLQETPRFVWIVHNGSEMRLPFEQLQHGDVIIVGAGETLPIDGTIVQGTASIDQHMLTGEAQPVEKSRGDNVYAATMVLAGQLHICVEQTGATTVAAQIGDVLARTTEYHTTIELRGTRLAETTALPQILLSVVTLPLLGPTRALAVLWCSIGYQVYLTGPLSVLNFLHIAAEHGILIKDGRALETLAQVDTVLFDKTGTLTDEQPHVGGIHCYAHYNEHDVLSLAAAAETRQSHPIARAILHETQTRHLTIPALDEIAYEPGYGLRVRLRDGRLVSVGSARFMQVENLELPASAHARQEICHTQGHSLVFVAVDTHMVGAIELHTMPRPEAATIVTALHTRGLRCVIISGDQRQPTLNLARQLGIDEVFAEVLPQEKASLVAKLQREGRTVCFVGDGINDSIALKQAHVSVSLQGATTIAIDTAQVVLMDKSVRQLPLLFNLAEHMDTNMQRNFLAGTVPGILNIGSVYLLRTGLIVSATFIWTGLMLGIANAMQPLIGSILQPLPALADKHETDADIPGFVAAEAQQDVPNP